MQKIICDFLTLWCESITCLSKRQQQLGYHHISCYTTTTFMLWYHISAVTQRLRLCYDIIISAVTQQPRLCYDIIISAVTQQLRLCYDIIIAAVTQQLRLCLWFLKLPGTHVSMIKFPEKLKKCVNQIFDQRSTENAVKRWKSELFAESFSLRLKSNNTRGCNSLINYVNGSLREFPFKLLIS